MNLELWDLCHEYKADIENALDLMLKEYPVLNYFISKIKVCEMNTGFKDAFASSYFVFGEQLKFEICLNINFFNTTGIENKFRDIRPNAYYYSVQDIIIHELAHALQIFYLSKKLHINLENYKQKDRRYYILLNSRFLINTIWKFYFWRMKCNRMQIRQYLGNYAANDVNEILPECFNNYYHLSKVEKLEDADKETYEFVKAVVNDYKKYIPDKI